MSHDEDTVDIALVLIMSGYAWWLDSHKQAEPDWTWVEVAVGSAVCLIAAGLRSRFVGGDWRAHERHTWRAFLLGGAPIIAGEISQAIRGWSQRDAYKRPRRDHTTPLA
jgi:hypothetical protein